MKHHLRPPKQTRLTDSRGSLLQSAKWCSNLVFANAPAAATLDVDSIAPPVPAVEPTDDVRLAAANNWWPGEMKDVVLHTSRRSVTAVCGFVHLTLLFEFVQLVNDLAVDDIQLLAAELFDPLHRHPILVL